MSGIQFSHIYWFAAFYNFLILFFHMGGSLEKYDSAHFNIHGVISILLWGLAYVSINQSYKQVPYLNLVFALEKFYYFVVWIVWLKGNHANLRAMFNENFLTGLFYSGYGIGDLLFGLFFLGMGLINPAHLKHN